MWWRFEPGTLTVEGQRLDAEAAPLTADIPEGYGPVGLQPVGLTFPSTGSWEITSRLGDHALTFVIYVVPPFPVPAATPDI